jgi:DNA-binding HxlR family transcriptional regulator
VELLGRRWTGAIVRALADGSIRFGDLTAAIPGLSDRMLSERLKELEAEGVVTRTVLPEHPVRIEYRLTEKGADLGAVMDEIGHWAHRWLAPKDEC